MKPKLTLRLFCAIEGAYPGLLPETNFKVRMQIYFKYTVYRKQYCAKCMHFAKSIRLVSDRHAVVSYRAISRLYIYKKKKKKSAVYLFLIVGL